MLALGHHATIIGDINFPDINWMDDPPTVRSECFKAFVDMCAAWNLSQVVPGYVSDLIIMM
jgi:hypothetical protein